EAQGRQAEAGNREAQGRQAEAGNREAQGRQAEAGNNLSPTRSASAIARSLKKGRNHQPMMIFKKSIPRRRFLRGAGTALALPMLDAMFPALASAAQTASRRVTRLSFFEVPNGIIMEKWTPASLGPGFELSPILE